MTNFKHVTFQEAFKAMKDGKRVQRHGWQLTDGTFAFMQLYTNVHAKTVETMTSLPDAVKAEFIRRREIKDDLRMHQELRYRSQFCIVHPDNFIYGWTPSNSDILAEDWIILD